MRFTPFALFPLLAFLVIVSCKNRNAEFFTKSLDDIVAIEKNRRGTIFAQNGASGPYQYAGTTTGNVNSAGHIAAGKGSQRIQISWPATEGFFYEGSAYQNVDGGAYLFVRKVPAP
jgi:hypothetical protein